MRLGLLLGGAIALAFQAVKAVPIIVYPGGPEDVWITKNNTINATTPAGAQYAPHFDAASSLPLQLKNLLGDSNIYAYVTGLDGTNQLAFLAPGGGNFYYPSTSSSAPQAIDNSDIGIPLGGQGSVTSVTVPGYLISARIYFSVGPLQFFVVSTGSGPGLVEPAVANPSDPNADVNWGFVEFNWASDSGIFADITAVDFVGLPLGIELSVNDGSGTQQALGLPSGAVSQVCSALQSQAASDGQDWGDECVKTSGGDLVRVIAPGDLVSQNPNAFSGYFDDYVNQVYSQYSSNTLTIETQAAAGLVQCKASGNVLTCDGDSSTYGIPTSADIFGCNSGPFSIDGSANGVHLAVVPRLCAAFNRGTFLLGADSSVQVDGYGSASGACQPSLPTSSYYPDGTPFNYYSKIVHSLEQNGLGYAFSYDDVNYNENVAGTVSSGSPNTFTVYVGGSDLV